MHGTEGRISPELQQGMGQQVRTLCAARNLICPFRCRWIPLLEAALASYHMQSLQPSDKSWSILMLSGRSSSRRAEVCLRFCHLNSGAPACLSRYNDGLIFNMRLILAYIQAIKCAREAIVLYCGSLTMPERQSEAPGLLTKAALHCIAAGVQQHSVLMSAMHSCCRCPEVQQAGHFCGAPERHSSVWKAAVGRCCDCRRDSADIERTA